MTKKRVVITEPIHEAGLQILSARSDLEVIQLPNADAKTLAENLPGAHAIGARAAKLTSEVLSQANDLQVISRYGVGCDNIDVPYASSRGIPVAIAAGANAPSVAEHTLMLLLAVARDLQSLDNIVRSGKFRDRDRFRSTDLWGSKILVIGFGRIGKRVASLCSAIGMTVIAADIKPDYQGAEDVGCDIVTDFRTLLGDADFISLHIPLDETTRHIISTEEFSATKKGAYLINCARGGVVDEDALIAALDSGQIAGAGIDVFAMEPPTDDNPLFSRSDVILTPHNAAASRGAAQAMSTMMAQNIIDCFDGRLKEDHIFNLELLKAR